MAQGNDGTSLRGPLLYGALALLCVFSAAGALCAWVVGERDVDQDRRSAADAGERVARDAALESTRTLSGEMRVRLDDARRGAETLAAAAGRAAHALAAAGPPHGELELLTGTLLRWHGAPGRDTFSIVRPGAERDDPALLRWEQTLGPVLRAVADGGALVRTSVSIDGLGLVGAPAAWALSAGTDEGIETELRFEMRAVDAPDAPGWVAADRGRMIYAAPVTGPDGSRIGTAWAELSAADVSAWIDSVASEHDGAALLSSEGLPLARSRNFALAAGAVADDEGEHGTDPVVVALRPLVGGEGVFYPAPPGRQVVARNRRLAAAGIDGAPFTTVTANPLGAVRLPDPALGTSSRRLGLAIFAGAVAFGMATLLAAWQIARRHARRVAPILETIEAHERADYSHTVEAGTDDEMGAIARWINTAAVRLRHAATRSEEGERRMSELIEASGDGLITTDDEDRIVHVNARFADLLRRPAASLVGRFVEELILPESLDRYRAQVLRQRDGHPARLEVVWDAARTPYPRTMAAGVPLFDDEGRYCGSYVIVTDLTDRVRVQEETARSEKVRALAEMAGGVAHDFNNVLTVVLGNAQYLLLEELSEDARETIRVIERTALDGTETIRRIREFTRARTVPVNAALVSMNDVVDGAVQAARRRFAASGRMQGVEHRVVVERRSRRRVRGTGAELQEALTHMIENAIEAMPQGGTLTVEAFDRGEDSVAVRVEDTGVGITPDQMKKLFDPFYTTKQAGRCPGLGLSIAFGIVRAHRGRIDVRSSAGAGSAFTVVLPGASSADAGEPTTGAVARVEPRVLLVGEDAAEMRQTLGELRKLGMFVVSVHANSSRALIADAAMFNTLVVEHELTGTSGWELARQARAARDDLRILLFTQPAAGVSETQARNAGIDRVIARPFDARDLHAETFALIAAPRERATTVEPASVRIRSHQRQRDENEASASAEVWVGGAVRGTDAAADSEPAAAAAAAPERAAPAEPAPAAGQPPRTRAERNAGQRSGGDPERKAARLAATAQGGTEPPTGDQH